MYLDIIFAFKFYFLTFIISLIFFPFTAKIFDKFYDKGYTLARLIGIVIVSYISWILAHTHILAFTTNNIWLITIIIGSISFYYYVYKDFYITLAKNTTHILISEVLYIVFFILMLMLRAEIPRIEGIEKFMDYAILNSLLRTDFLPLQDVWYAGASINYYYFGQYIIAALIKLAVIPVSYGYNIAIGFIFANVCTLTYYIARNITKSQVLSFMAVVLLAIGGNLDHIHKIIFLHKSDYFYAEARSLIEFTINEFPAYSFLIGDMHAHILNIANVLIYIAFLYNLFLTKKTSQIYLVILGFWLGILYTTNSWDFVMYFGLTLLILSILKLKQGINVKTFFELILEFMLIFSSFIIPFIPFFMNFKPAVSGVGLVHEPRSPIFKIFIMFGFFIFLCLPYLLKLKDIKLKSFTKSFKKPKSLITLIKDKITLNETFFGYIILFFGVILIITPEIVFLKDIYHQTTPDYYRANTVFKVWYQAWILLSFAAVIAIKYTLDKIRSLRLKRIVLFFTMAIVVSVVGSYMEISVRYLIGSTYKFETLDGKAYLNEEYADENQMIDWINHNIKGQHVLLEADGESYSMQSLFSSYTGLASIVGWTNHEFGWRNNWPVLSLRLGDIRILYTSPDTAEVKELLQKNKIEYVIIGRFEKEKFGSDAGETIKRVSTVVHESGEVQLLYIHQPL